MTYMNIISSTAKTAILKSDQGWFDRDQPNTFCSTRSQARSMRRTRLSTSMPAMLLSYNSDGSVTKAQAVRRTLRSVAPPTLQERAAARLRSMGVNDTDISEVIPSFGYNASVSYGHMRITGATHAEALEVISLGFPDTSLSYGQKRQRGMNHTDALILALDE